MLYPKLVKANLRQEHRPAGSIPPLSLTCESGCQSKEEGKDNQTALWLLVSVCSLVVEF